MLDVTINTNNIGISFDYGLLKRKLLARSCKIDKALESAAIRPPKRVS